MQQPAPITDASVLSGIVEAVRDGDERVLRRLLARLAEQATVADVYALRDALAPHPGPGVGREGARQ
ncbi:hypothetical protein PUR71_03085 [Streptomyces sp. SP17BM10]|uniref:hypothetical protein n=1 Tax=Streptomyces sp. SP17BM10 TaxID=3002530 RepID=UPI002E78337C|nr:hypothetical protein [Streptomyces sp. SP17BM10]MEE1781919.1 hypothetical protein [Streptomyces sp. SP17BM10]